VSGWIPFPRVGAAVLATLVLAAPWLACKTPLDRAFGKSYRENVARTIANPEAGEDALDAPRPDGASTDSALDKFRSEERKVDQGEEKPVINLKVGG